MSTIGTKRSNSELPSLKRVRNVCFLCMGGALVAFLAVSAITATTLTQWVISRALAVTLTITLYFFLIGLRTHIIVHQLTRDRRQIFDRPAPEWLTVAFLLSAALVAFWPHRP